MRRAACTQHQNTQRVHAVWILIEEDGRHRLDSRGKEDAGKERAVEGLERGLVLDVTDVLLDDVEREEQRHDQHNHQAGQVVPYVAP
eukprot:1984871-Rhodomonas_salina.1